jgi:hypothetical protein
MRHIAVGRTREDELIFGNDLDSPNSGSAFWLTVNNTNAGRVLALPEVSKVYSGINQPKELGPFGGI